MKLIIDKYERNQYADLTGTVDKKSDEYAVAVTQLLLRNYQLRIVEEHDGRLLSAQKILEALKRHTTLGIREAVGEDVPAVEVEHVLIALERMQVPELLTTEGLFWDLGSLNSPPRDKAAIHVFLRGGGNVFVRTVA